MCADEFHVPHLHIQCCYGVRKSDYIGVCVSTGAGVVSTGLKVLKSDTGQSANNFYAPCIDIGCCYVVVERTVLLHRIGMALAPFWVRSQ